MLICKNNLSLAQIFDKKKTYELRGICMIMIILHHCYLREPIDFLGSIFMLKMGYLCTGFFFLLSGYGMYFSLKKNTPLKVSYVYNKMQKLFLPFIYIWILFVILKLFGIYHEPLRISDFLLLKAPNRGTWFFEVIVVVYLLTFMIFKIIKNDNFRILILLLATSIYICVCRHYNLGHWWWDTIFCYFLGVLIAHHVNEINIRCNIWIYLLTSFILFELSNGNNILESIFFSSFLLFSYSLIECRSSKLEFIGKNSLIFYFAGDVAYRLFRFDNPYVNYFTWIVLSIILSTFIVYVENFANRKFRLV